MRCFIGGGGLDVWREVIAIAISFLTEYSY